MPRLSQIETFVAVATLGSLAAAARAANVTPALLGRRLQALETRLGVRLLQRTTRRMTLTEEGHAFLDEAQRILNELDAAEANVARGGATPTGLLRVSAPAGFGRRHVAPLLPGLLDQHPGMTASLDLSDRLVDLVSERFDVAVRLGDLADSSLTSVRLADNQRVVVAAQRYLARHGTPRAPADLAHHACLTLAPAGSQERGWLFRVGGEVVAQRVRGPLSCSDGAALLDWVREGRGLAWRSRWEVQADLDAGRLVAVLADYASPPNGIYAVFPGRRHLPLRVRVFVEHLRHTYAQPGYWSPAGLPSAVPAPTGASP